MGGGGLRKETQSTAGFWTAGRQGGKADGLTAGRRQRGRRRERERGRRSATGERRGKGAAKN